MLEKKEISEAAQTERDENTERDQSIPWNGNFILYPAMTLTIGDFEDKIWKASIQGVTGVKVNVPPPAEIGYNASVSSTFRNSATRYIIRPIQNIGSGIKSINEGYSMVDDYN